MRFPISAKILLWFFLNLAFLGAAAWIFARVQLRFGLDSLLAGPVNDRLQTMGEVLARQFAERPPAEWPGILESSAASYHVQLALYRNDGGWRFTDVTREAGPVKGGTTVIAFVTDPDGYKIELIQRKEFAPSGGLR